MNPDRSYNARYPAGFSVQIRYGRRRLHGAYGRDLTIHGLYLELRAMTLPEGTPVELEIDALGHPWLVQAVVTHGDRCGIGVRFIEPQPQLVAELAGADLIPMSPRPPTPSRAPLLQRPGH
jgi:PilZ domain